ncbi:hypothetical protein D5F01_LYC11711 [Larimichthys crocea]|uniref:Uncharacterized protein n=1 Tax=Larimichthys crocea TaxID=215358 RepID=A0A6G0IER7_LARCR|nr:hypothetical protein D5F01_LYC11711 [Larimichthys crocea]
MRSSATLVNYLSLLQYIKSVEISSVCSVGGVFHAVDHDQAAGHFQVHQLRRVQPVLQTPVFGDLIGRVSAHPAVGGVRFLDIHNYRVCYICVLLHDSLKRLQTRHERWSGAAAKVEDERSLVLCVIQDAAAPLILQLNNFSVGRSVSEMRRFEKVQFMSVPHCLEGLQAEETIGV